ncbi:MAG: amidohydrolase [Candidatus Methanosuratincola sp.]
MDFRRVLFRRGVDSFSGEEFNVLVAGGRVVYRGKEEPSGDEVVDLEGGFILPGFVDAHCHILSQGLHLERLDLFLCQTREEVLARLRDFALSTQEEWIQAVNYDANRFSDGRDILAKEIDQVVPHFPVVLRHVSGHSIVVNTEAFRRAGITSSTPDPKGGRICRDESGNPTGVLEEEAVGLIYRCIPKPTRLRMEKAIEIAWKRMFSLGITSAADMATGTYDLSHEFSAYRALADSGRGGRTVLYVLHEKALNFGDGPCAYESGALWRVGGAKIFVDGAIGPGTAALRGTYEGGGSGYLILERDALVQVMRDLEARGWRVALHAIGDRAMDEVIEVLQTCEEPQRHRIEHAMILDEEQLVRLKELGCWVVMQPEFLLRFHGAYFRRLGEMARRLKPFRSALRIGVRVAFSSDAPIVSGDPWLGIATAVDRPSGFDPSENVSWEEAVMLYTKAAGEVVGLEVGGLSIGEWADFQVYARSPRESPSSLVRVFRGGEEVYSA